MTISKLEISPRKLSFEQQIRVTNKHKCAKVLGARLAKDEGERFTKAHLQHIEGRADHSMFLPISGGWMMIGIDDSSDRRERFKGSHKVGWEREVERRKFFWGEEDEFIFQLSLQRYSVQAALTP